MKQTAVMQLINFILVERRQEDGSIKFHSHEDFSRFLQMEKDQIKEAWVEGGGYSYLSEQSDRILAEQYYNETFNTKEK